MTADQADLNGDPLHGHPAVQHFFGDAYPRVLAFTELLAEQGVIRGLVGPRELSRMWDRHILNSAAVAPFLKPGTMADVGSGAGLPGLVVAAMEPRRSVVLIEPMDRRTVWLREAAQACGIDNVTVVRARAEELAGQVAADVVTARAVASVDKLAKWCAPLLRPDGEMVFLKGRSAADEVERAKYVLRKLGLTAEVLEARTIDAVQPTVVVRLTRS